MNSLDYDIRFQARAKRAEAWGSVLLAAAVVLWLWFAVLLLMPYDSSRGMCESRLFTDGSTANSGSSYRQPCAAQRDWPELLGVLGLSVPVSVAGAVLLTGGRGNIRMSGLAAEIARLNKAVGQ
jgi:hypothetical protein